MPTPFNEDRTADLSYVKAAAEQIAPMLRSGNIVVLESASRDHADGGRLDRRPTPGSQDATDCETGADIFVAHCPERVLFPAAS
ncbi:hypothetical protein [Pararhizobium sp. LjRoot255]|uniref:hypothetical protein n=1 Tax=Pararhizobium sp. LjRoot255 TaxID=3342298 RepID=UPI003F4F5586